MFMIWAWVGNDIMKVYGVACVARRLVFGYSISWSTNDTPFIAISALLLFRIVALYIPESRSIALLVTR